MRKYALAFVLAVACVAIQAQPGPIQLSTERNSDNSISVMGENTSHATYSVMLNFSTLIGYSSSVTQGTFIKLVPGHSQLARLTPERNAGSTSFNYSYRYLVGEAFRKKPETIIEYLLPAMPGKRLMTFPVNSVAQRLGIDTANDYHAVGFRYGAGDTICAARAGTVYEVIDDVKVGEKIEQTYRSNRNRISIEHRDGTLSYYSLLAPIKSLVGVGEQVYPGQPIAVFNQNADKYSMLFSVFYLMDKNAQFSDIAPSGTKYYNTIATVFHTAETGGQVLSYGLYTADFPSALVAKELTKREKKKLGL